MEIGFITSVVSVLQEAGVSPAGIVFAVVILILLYRAWRKEDTLSGRQDAFYRMVMQDISEIRKAHEHCEQQIQNLSATNMIIESMRFFRSPTALNLLASSIDKSIVLHSVVIDMRSVDSSVDVVRSWANVLASGLPPIKNYVRC